jgi:DNA-directed RNA polymerase subunit H
MSKFEVGKHVLVPKHSKLSEKDAKELFEKYSIDLQNLPRIYKNDPAIVHLDVNEGDVVKIVRKSPTAGESVFYRRVAV